MYILRVLFPFKKGKRVYFHTKFNENNTIVSNILFKILML